MKGFVALCILLVAVGLASATKFELSKSVSSLDVPVNHDGIIEYLNSIPNKHWTAGRNERFDGMTRREFQVLLGAKKGGPKLPLKVHDVNAEALPAQFDARKQWASCATIDLIRDQGHCGSCWAFGFVESFSDRICIQAGQNVTVAANDVLACCDSCGDGCDGGYPQSAWQYGQQTGNVDEGCDPYFDQQGCHHPGCSPEWPTPQCTQTCNNTETWSAAKHFVSNVYGVSSDQNQIMQEIMTNGPVEAAFDVYEDFASYQSGVYHHVSGGLLGGHAISIIGWGVSGSQPYWIVRNSWNRTWGMNGYFWILRGSDECGIEDSVVAGTVQSSKMF